MKKHYLLTLAFLFLGILGLISRSGGPGTVQGIRATGAGGSIDNFASCSSCHGGGAGGGSVSAVQVAGPGGYVPGTTYNMTVTINDAGANVGGFQLVAVNSSNLNAGTLINIPGDAQLFVNGGYDFLEQNAAKGFTANAVTWAFDWTAPVTDEGNITFYVAGNAADGTGNTAGDAGYQSSLTLGALAVDLVSFEVTQLNDAEASLNWITAVEVNSDRFEIQRALTGQNFKRIAEIASFGDTDQMQSYQYIDAVPVFNQSILYRLKEIDINGNVQFSEVVEVSVQRSNEGIIALYPNPAILTQSINLDYALLNDGPLSIRVIDLSGRLVFSRNEEIQAGRKHIQVPVSNLKSGTYLLEVRASKQVQTKRFVVAN